MMSLLRSNLFDRYRIVIFDLDNTLYDESTYLFAVYKDIGKYIEQSVGGVADDYTFFLINTFQHEGHHKLFDKFLSHFNLKGKIEIDNLLSILRCKSVILRVYDELKEMLTYLLMRDYDVYLLTNGNVEQQQNKIKNLDIQEMLFKIQVIYANAYIPKPSPFCINRILVNSEMEKKYVIMIGDSDVDEMTAKNAGIDFINVKEIIDHGITKY